MKDLQLTLLTLSLTDHVYASLSIQILQIILSTEELVNSGASANFIFITFTQMLRIASLDLVSLRVMSADGSEISPSGNGFFYSLIIAVNEKTSSVHLF